MLTLYMAVTGGSDWVIYYDILYELGSFTPLLFVGYTFSFAFAIFNILTGIFVERAVAANMPDREQQIVLERQRLREQADVLRDLFSCSWAGLDELFQVAKGMDLDSSGTISLDERLGLSWFPSCFEGFWCA